MTRTITALGLAGLLLAGCAAESVTTAEQTRRDEGYTPTGSNIPRREPKRSDVPAVSNSQLDTLLRGAGPGRIQ